MRRRPLRDGRTYALGDVVAEFDRKERAAPTDEGTASTSCVWRRRTMADQVESVSALAEGFR